MNKFILGFLIILGIIIFFCIFIIIFITNNRKIKNILYRVNESEKSIIKKIKAKADLLTRCANIIENKLKIESKTLEGLKKIKIDKINDFKLDKQFNKCYGEILKIFDDKDELKKNKAFKEHIKELEDIELRIVSLRTYYNKYTMQYNSLLNTFPKKLIAKIKKYSLKAIFDGKEIGEEFKNDITV